MTDEQKELFEKYTDCVREYQTITDCLIFQNSFKLGAIIMLEAMEDNQQSKTRIVFKVVQIYFLVAKSSWRTQTLFVVKSVIIFLKLVAFFAITYYTILALLYQRCVYVPNCY